MDSTDSTDSTDKRESVPRRVDRHGKPSASGALCIGAVEGFGWKRLVENGRARRKERKKATKQGARRDRERRRSVLSDHCGTVEER
jgi:hypothetical protein